MITSNEQWNANLSIKKIFKQNSHKRSQVLSAHLTSIDYLSKEQEGFVCQDLHIEDPDFAEYADAMMPLVINQSLKSDMGAQVMQRLELSEKPKCDIRWFLRCRDGTLEEVAGQQAGMHNS